LVKRYLLISDIHDNKESIEKLLDRHREDYFDAIFFCGDAVAPFTINFLINQFDEKTEKLFIVLGNNEGEVYKIVKDLSQFEGKSVEFSQDFMFLNINSFRGLLTHGWGGINQTRKIIESLGKSGDYKFIFFGHTHMPELVLVDGSNNISRSSPSDNIVKFEVNINEYKSIIVNPGELGGWLFGSMNYSIIVIDRDKVEISFLTLPKL